MRGRSASRSDQCRWLMGMRYISATLRVVYKGVLIDAPTATSDQGA